MGPSRSAARKQSELSRRDFLRVGSLAPLGIGLTQFLQASGGPSQKGTTRRGKAPLCFQQYLAAPQISAQA